MPSMQQPSQHQPGWDVPSPYGQAAAIESMGTAAAPLLAGFSITFATLILTSPERFRWVAVTLVLSVVATVALIAALQFAFRTRTWAVTPSDMEQWWPDAQDPARHAELVHEQRRHHANYRLWSKRARFSYNAGIVTFLAALTTALIPPGHITSGRYLAIGLAVLGTLAEAAWIVTDFGISRRGTGST
jgi:hypothetical protein